MHFFSLAVQIASTIESGSSNAGLPSACAKRRSCRRRAPESALRSRSARRSEQTWAPRPVQRRRPFQRPPALPAGRAPPRDGCGSASAATQPARRCSASGAARSHWPLPALESPSICCTCSGSRPFSRPVSEEPSGHQYDFCLHTILYYRVFQVSAWFITIVHTQCWNLRVYLNQ